MTPTGSDFPERQDHPDRDAASALHRWSFGVEAEEVERPHVVVTLDTRTGWATFSGPYRTAIGALCAADVEYQVDRDQGGRGELTFHVAALHTPIGTDDPDLLFDGELPRADHEVRPLAQVLALVTTVASAAERTIRRRPRIAAGSLAGAAAACATGPGDGWTRRGRPPRYRHLLGRVAR